MNSGANIVVVMNVSIFVSINIFYIFALICCDLFLKALCG